MERLGQGGARGEQRPAASTLRARGEVLPVALAWGKEEMAPARSGPARARSGPEEWGCCGCTDVA
jgi:hypothetical protein